MFRTDFFPLYPVNVYIYIYIYIYLCGYLSILLPLITRSLFLTMWYVLFS